MDVADFKTLVAGETLSVTMSAADGYTAAKLVLKKINIAVIVLNGTLSSGVWTFSASSSSTASYVAGNYTFQAFETTSTDKRLAYSGSLTISANLESSASSFDPRSADEIILEAVIAVMSGTASQTQRSVSVGDKSLQYMSFSELAEKRAYFENRVADAQAENNGGGSNTIFTTFTRV